MSTSLPPAPPDSIQRILFLSPRVHIYTVPPLTSTKGYTTTAWSPLLLPPSPTSTPEPTTTRLRIIETSSSSSETPTIATQILLEDRSTGALFAACPYTSRSCVEPTLDSARFFAIRVQGEGGRKAVLGIGFEERGEGCEFVDVLRSVGKVMGWEEGSGAAKATDGRGGARGGKNGGDEGKKDWSLKDGEMIRIEIGGVNGKVDGGGRERRREEGAGGALFSMMPPPSGEGGGGGGMPFLPPPPSAKEVKAERRRSRGPVEMKKESAAELGFDDGEFGEFQ